MKEHQLAINNFLATLYDCKGTVGQLVIEAESQPGEQAYRGGGSFVSRTATRDGKTRPVPFEAEEGRGSSTRDGKLYLGERARFSPTIPRDGYLRLYNLGGDGSCALLFPHHPSLSGMRVAGARQYLPSANEWYVVNRPTFEESGQPDCVLALWLADSDILTIADLDPRLRQRNDWRGSAGFGS